MRSRYSAFVLGRVDYLQDTWHASTRPATLEANEPGLKRLGLVVKRH
jgi:SEC-C motif-containing protein